MKRSALIFVILVTACSSDPVPSADVGVDATRDTSDAFIQDFGTDVGLDSRDMRDARDDGNDVVDSDVIDTQDMFVSPDGFGTLSGMCGELDDELVTGSPTLLENAIDFEMNPYDASDREALTAGGRRILDEGNAGGSSVLSELFSYEVIARCDGAELLKTESTISYDTPGSITDYLVSFETNKIGVSVTRVFSFPRDAAFNTQNVANLVTRKLEDILESSTNVSAEDAWTKQILHLITDTEEGAAGLRQIIPTIDADTRADTVVLITVTDGADDPIYEE